MKEKRNTAIYFAYDDETPFDPVTCEKNLLRAVLMSAMYDLKKSGQVAEEAKHFFLSPEDDYLFSFNSICSYLGVDPKRILLVTGLQPQVSDNFASSTGKMRHRISQ